MKNGCGFRSFFLGGFECSCHVLPSGKRLDVIASTAHDVYAREDYERLRNVGINTARDGIRWHLIEKRPYYYDWSSVLPMIRAAQDTGTQVIWDLCHYGWPEDLDVFQPEFVRRFGAFARAFANLLVNETDDTPYLSPINEISFLSWGAGDHGFLNPFATGRGTELKCQLARATIAAIDAIRDVAPDTRFAQIDPLIHVVTEPWMTDTQKKAAEDYTRVQFQANDILAGKQWPQIGGDPKYLDIIGANYYVHNQWVIDGNFIERTDYRYRPLNELLNDLYTRYQRPLFIAETGIEDDRRPEWLAYVTGEVITALEAGIPVEGICLYPIVNHPGWLDDRHCHNGMWDYCNDCGHREVYNPLAEELQRQTIRVERVLRKIQSQRHAASAIPPTLVEEANAAASY